ncbi:hypothetical protein HZH66_003290 [Vespula vulgaris]|uniref:Ig-like domain-containing protein n=1 Tax=Vespula vulgaris TaxID=7454 RepID=A0A834NIJ3_VESVU|nr:hypothetical protein HZH66_003290 [Vespula vulgaris]
MEKLEKLGKLLYNARMAHGPLYGMASRDLVTCFLLTAFLYSSFGQTLPKSEIQPQFLAPLENHTVTQGRDVSFTCVVNHLQSYKIAWIKSDSRAILAIHTHMVAHNPRLSVTHNGHNTWKLHVSNVQPNDSGTYMCQINTDPMESQTGYMKVVIPPDIMDLDDSADLLTTKESNDLRLRCRATGTPKPTVTWRREDGREITLRSELGVKRVQSYEGEQLHLVGILRQEMGSYLCIASNGVPPTVSKRYHVNVRFKPLIKVTNQLVAAPTNSNVILQCYVESSPRASNTWYKDNGIKLLANDKHNVSEFTVNDYAYQLNLTIKQLSRNDFGSYICSAENPYGKAEGTIRLQELHLSRTTVPTIRNTESVERQNWRKQIERKGGKKHSYALGREVGSTNSTQRNVPPHPLHPPPPPPPHPRPPAPAPAHSAPTQLDAQSDATSTRYFRSVHQLHLTVVVLLFAMTSSY